MQIDDARDQSAIAGKSYRSDRPYGEGRWADTAGVYPKRDIESVEKLVQPTRKRQTLAAVQSLPETP
jgi:hypothetical protein